MQHRQGKSPLVLRQVRGQRKEKKKKQVLEDVVLSRYCTCIPSVVESISMFDACGTEEIELEVRHGVDGCWCPQRRKIRCCVGVGPL